MCYYKGMKIKLFKGSKKLLCFNSRWNVCFSLLASVTSRLVIILVDRKSTKLTQLVKITQA